jgi:hypothetical protein
MSQYLDLTELALVPGPLYLGAEPAWSFDSSEVIIYSPQQVADAIIGIPGTRMLQSADPSWEFWRARWENEDRWIEFSIGETEAASVSGNSTVTSWGGSDFNTHCLLQDVLYVWEEIRTKIPGVWLHDTDCRLWSPESFAGEYGI